MINKKELKNIIGENENMKNKKELLIKKCNSIGCVKEFETFNNLKKYCNIKCRVKNNWYKNKINKMVKDYKKCGGMVYIKKCVVCLKEFKTIKDKKITCFNSCYLKLYRLQHKDYFKKTNKNWYLKNKEYFKKYRKEHLKKILNYQNNYYKQHIDYFKNYYKNYKLKKKELKK